MDDKMKCLLNKIKIERKKKNRNVDEIKELEIESVKIKYANNVNKLKFAVKELKKVQAVNENIHEFKQEILLDYTGEFEKVGTLKVGDQTRHTHIRFRNITDYEAHINSIDGGYDDEDAFFNSYI